MKIFNYFLACILGGIAIGWLFAGDWLAMFIILLLAIIFFLFGFLEEKNKEISSLRQTILKMKNYYMID